MATLPFSFTIVTSSTVRPIHFRAPPLDTPLLILSLNPSVLTRSLFLFYSSVFRAKLYTFFLRHSLGAESGPTRHSTTITNEFLKPRSRNWQACRPAQSSSSSINYLLSLRRSFSYRMAPGSFSRHSGGGSGSLFSSYFSALLLLLLNPTAISAQTAADYYVKSLPGAPEGPLLKMHAG